MMQSSLSCLHEGRHGAIHIKRIINFGKSHNMELNNRVVQQNF